jgi:ribosomal protein S12 methylthiotransferase
VKISYLNLGCPKNQVDLETILGGLSTSTTITDDVQNADAVIINTCSFIESSKRESIDAIFDIVSLKELNPNLKVLVTGCLPQRYKEEVAELIPEVDQFFYTVSAQTTSRDVQQFLQQPVDSQPRRVPLSPKHYAYLRISEGCDNRCSYCAIPLIKGRYASRPMHDILEDAHRLANEGVKELMLIAQDTTIYGHDLPGNLSLDHLLRQLHDIDGFEWIRLLYTHPAHWQDSLIDTLASLDKVVNYVDVPIQHIADPILKKMGRRVDRRGIENLIAKIREKIPAMALRTSIITGFPGETDEHFDELMAFLCNVQFERLGVFTYSHEEETRAYKMKDDVPDDVKLDRQRQIMNLQSDIAETRNASLIGKQLKVLVDEIDKKNNVAFARSEWDAPEIDGNILLTEPVVEGEFYTVRITDSHLYDLTAELI